MPSYKRKYKNISGGASIGKIVSKRRKFVKARYSRQAPRMIPKGIPQKQSMVSRYSEVYTYSHATGVSANQYFCGNGMYDPDVSGTGHQPMLFDQYMALYQYYRVYGCKATIDVENTGSNPVNVVVYGTTDGATTLTPNEVCEQPGAITRMINEYSSPSQNRIVWYGKTRGFFPNLNINDNALAGSDSQNPSSRWYIFVNCSGPSGGQTDALYRVTLQYYCVFYGPKKLVGS